MHDDYCTSWWDGWPAWLGGTGDEWRHCCFAHDLAYGGGFFNSFGGDVDLLHCVASAGGSTIAAIMFTGVATFGTLIKIGIANRFRPGREQRDR